MLKTSHLIVTASGWSAVSLVTLGRAADFRPGVGLADVVKPWSVFALSSLSVAWAFAMVGSVGPDVDIKLPLVPHRGATHSLVATAAFTALAVAFALYLRLDPVVIGAGACWGWLSHLLADTCTPHGVPYLWPLKHRTSWRLFPTGSGREVLMVFAWILVCAGASYLGLRGAVSQPS